MDYTKNFEKIDNSTKRLTITVPATEIDNEYQKTVKKYAKELTVNGFRKGKAPNSVIERKYGETIRNEAFSDNIDKIIEEIFSNEDMDKVNNPINPKNLHFENEDDIFPIKENEDVVCKITYSTLPEFDLPEYKGLDVEYNEVKFDAKKALDDEIDRLLEQNAMIIEKEDKIAEKGNIVTLDVKVSDEEGTEIAAESREDYVFTISDKTEPFELDSKIIGMKLDEVKSVSKTKDKVKKNYQNTLKKIKVKELPELDDEFAQDVKEEYKTLDMMKEALAKEISDKHEKEVKDLKIQSLFDTLSSSVEMDIPQELIDMQADNEWSQFVSNFAQQSQTSFQDAEKYLTQMNYTKASYIANSTDQLKEKVKISLIIDEITKKEEIKASEEEITEEMKKTGYAENENKDLVEYIKGQVSAEIESKKTYELLLENNNFKVKKEVKEAPKKAEKESK
ncbi:MAG: trigger factor [Sphaerochaetaceae bacterium]|nr:trigger factor [Sphaerochaetaceae bacterium]